MGPIFSAAHRDAQLTVALSHHREYPSHGVSLDRRSRVGGGPTSVRTWIAAPACGASRTRRRAVAARQPCGVVAHGDLAIHVFRRHEILLPYGLLGEDGGPIPSSRLYFCGPSQSGHGRRYARESSLEQAGGRSFALAVVHRGDRRTIDWVTVTPAVVSRSYQSNATGNSGQSDPANTRLPYPLAKKFSTLGQNPGLGHTVEVLLDLSREAS